MDKMSDVIVVNNLDKFVYFQKNTSKKDSLQNNNNKGSYQVDSHDANKNKGDNSQGKTPEKNPNDDKKGNEANISVINIEMREIIDNKNDKKGDNNQGKTNAHTEKKMEVQKKRKVANISMDSSNIEMKSQGDYRKNNSKKESLQANISEDSNNIEMKREEALSRIARNT